MAEAVRRLNSIDVSFISLVGKGANGKQIIFKSAGNTTPNIGKTITIIKTDEEKRLVYGTVYEPEVADSQGDIANASVIEKSAHTFLAKLKNTNVDTQHDFVADDGAVVESFILRSADPMFPDTKINSWVVAIKVAKDDTWALIKSGEISGLSLAGLAEVEPIEKSFWSKLKKALHIEKDFNSELNERNIWDYIYALENAVRDILNDDTCTDKNTAINASITQFQTAMGTIVMKSGKVLSADNMEKIKAAHQHLADVIKSADCKEPVQKNKNGDIQMITEELKKAIEDSLDPVITRLDALEKADITEKITKALEPVIARIDVVEKATPGSTQASATAADVQKGDVKIWT